MLNWKRRRAGTPSPSWTPATSRQKKTTSSAASRRTRPPRAISCSCHPRPPPDDNFHRNRCLRISQVISTTQIRVADSDLDFFNWRACRPASGTPWGAPRTRPAAPHPASRCTGAWPTCRRPPASSPTRPLRTSASPAGGRDALHAADGAGPQVALHDAAVPQPYIDNASFLRNLLVHIPLDGGAQAERPPRWKRALRWCPHLPIPPGLGLGSTVTRDLAITVVTLTGGSTYEPLMVECKSWGGLAQWPDGVQRRGAERDSVSSAPLQDPGRWASITTGVSLTRITVWCTAGPPSTRSTPAALPNPLLNRARKTSAADFWKPAVAGLATRKAWLLEHDIPAMPTAAFVEGEGQILLERHHSGSGGMAIAQGGFLARVLEHALMPASSRTERYQFFFQSDWKQQRMAERGAERRLSGAPRAGRRHHLHLPPASKRTSPPRNCG